MLSLNCAVVIPCFNEGATIAEVVRGVRRMVGRMVGRVIVVDDGSSDDTAAQAEAAGAMVIRHEENRGKGAALRSGLTLALRENHEWAATLDGDGQHAPEDLPKLLAGAEKTGAPLVIGNRMHAAREMSWLRRAVNRWMSERISRRAGRELPDTQSGFRVVHLPTWAALGLSTERFEVESEMLLAFIARGCAVEFVPVRVIPRQGRSRIRPVEDTLRWWKWWREGERVAMRTAEPGGPFTNARSREESPELFRPFRA
jgi:glycosyltransferase involved in cell wall biosynthesis